MLLAKNKKNVNIFNRDEKNELSRTMIQMHCYLHFQNIDVTN